MGADNAAPAAASAVASHLKVDPYVVLAIFSGRRDRESVLFRYVAHLAKMGFVDEVHLHVEWRTTSQDKQWLQGFTQNAPFNVTLVQNPHGWASSYSFYTERWAPPPQYANRTVIVKADDDIVFVDVKAFPGFVRYVADNPDMFLVFGNIVNNGVAAYYQQQGGLIPHDLEGQDMTMEYPQHGGQWGRGGTLLHDKTKAEHLHSWFIANREKFLDWQVPEGACIRYHPPGMEQRQGRFSLNWFGVHYQNMAGVVELTKDHPMDDEVQLTTNNVRYTNCMYTRLTVAHLAFCLQGDNLWDTLGAYEALGESLLS